MGGRAPGTRGSTMPTPSPHAQRTAPSQRCHLILQRCLAVQLSKPGVAPSEDFWMYDSGYMLFQSFLSANSRCWWNAPLVAAVSVLRYAGHVSPGMLLVTADACALEVLRGAFARGVLKPPASYVVCGLGDIDDCIVAPVVQGQFTPLPEALCDVIMELSSSGQSAVLESIRRALSHSFPLMQTPTQEIIYDSLSQLTQERKIYQTSRGYFIVTPERRRSRSHSRGGSRSHQTATLTTDMDGPLEPRTVLMTNSEAIHSLYGEIATFRDGDRTHQCIQTNLADVICGGNPNDKVLYARCHKPRSGSFPCSPRSLERRHSLRLFGSSKRLQRFASTRSLSKAYHHHNSQYTTDSSSSEYQSTDSTSPKKVSLLSRLFRRSGRSKQRAQIKTFSAQFPPSEWFNSSAIHLHSVATQTTDHDATAYQQLSQSTFYDGSEYSQRSSTLPRRHRRHLSNESTILISSRDHSPIRRKSPICYSGSLPRSTHSIPSSSKSSKHSIRQQKEERNKSMDKAAAERKKANPSGTESTAKCESEPSVSGPSSLETMKTGSLKPGVEPHYMANSGPSSLESTMSSSTMIPSPKLAPVKMAAGKSPKHSPIHKPVKSDTKIKQEQNKQDVAGPNVPSSGSNNSITLQVTTNTSNQNGNTGNTKIFVQNSPVRSVITFENGKLMENSNVFIINNESKNGDISHTFNRHQTKPVTSPEKQFVEPECVKATTINNEIKNDTVCSLDQSKFTKNFNNDATMNNSRKLSLQLQNNAQSNGSLSYKNVLKNIPNAQNSNPSSPVVNKNVLGFEPANLLPVSGSPPSPTKSHDSIAGSAGNLRYFEKNALASDPNRKLSQNKLNSNCDLKNSQLYLDSGANLIKKAPLNSNPNITNLNLSQHSQNTISTDSIANMLAKNVTEHKNMTTVGSEPNLTYKNQEIMKQKPVLLEKQNSVSMAERRYSLSRENSAENPDLYNFPSLSDLSLNFTSLAAQKILKGVSINSIDTLVELNMAATGTEKQNNCDMGTVCTDFGLV